jgi:hypothetical protein
MATLIFLVKILPFWAFPAALVFGDLTIFYRRRRQKVWVAFLSLALIFVGAGGLWIGFRGDLHADSWVYGFFGGPESRR